MKPVEVLPTRGEDTLTFLPELFSFPPAALSLMRSLFYLAFTPYHKKKSVGEPSHRNASDSAGSGCRLSGAAPVMVIPRLSCPLLGIILWWNTLSKRTSSVWDGAPECCAALAHLVMSWLAMLALGMLSQTHAAVAQVRRFADQAIVWHFGSGDRHSS